MALGRRFARYYACCFVFGVASLLMCFAFVGSYKKTLQRIRDYTVDIASIGVPKISFGFRLGEFNGKLDSQRWTDQSPPLFWRNPDNRPHTYRFSNGDIVISESIYDRSQKQLSSIDPVVLDSFFESIVMETTADCSTTQRFGRRADFRGWDLCIVGPVYPREPCFMFSLGRNNIWEFEDQVAKSLKCQVLAFGPKMPQQNHMHKNKVTFIQEDLLDSIPANAFLRFLKRFQMENVTIDVLKINIEASVLPSLEAAVENNFLKNVKQMLLTTHFGKDGKTQKDLKRFIRLFEMLHELGFRQWQHKWSIQGPFSRTLSSRNLVQPCCIDMYYINTELIKQQLNPLKSRTTGGGLML